jgi:hypothetical protein
VAVVEVGELWRIFEKADDVEASNREFGAGLFRDLGIGEGDGFLGVFGPAAVGGEELESGGVFDADLHSRRVARPEGNTSDNTDYLLA